MQTRAFLLFIALSLSSGWAQQPCASATTYTPCEFTFELSEKDAAAHPNPYVTVDLHAEFRSPRYRTFLMPAFWDGGRKIVIRFTPTEPGEWIYRLTSNIAEWDGKNGKFSAASSSSAGFIQPRNVHHWAYAEENKPHLWMGDTCYSLATIEQSLFQGIVDARAAQKFNHMRGLVLGWAEDASKSFPNPEQPNPAHFRALDERIHYMNQKGIIADLILAADQNHLVKQFPVWQQRERYIRYLVARYAPMNITWQGVQEFEEYENGRALLKEVGELLKKIDPYQHPRTTHTTSTSASLLGDGWMDHVAYQSSSDSLGAIEHQLYTVPFVNLEFGYEDSGAGKSHPHHVDADVLRKRLWNATMNGQYVTFGNTGTYGGRKIAMDAKYLESPGAKQMTVWYDFFAATRHWELEPYFDVDGGRALALEGVEYIIYLENPGPVEILLERHGYDVAWVNPINGERLPQKDFKSERYAAEPPDKTHDWVLHISREGRKEGMLRSYKFDSRKIFLQEVEVNRQKLPYDIEEPSKDTLPVAQPVPYAARIKRETRATRAIMWLWTGEVAVGAQGYRVLATSQKGNLTIPPSIATDYPANMVLRLYGMNSNGKVYSFDQTYKLTR
jgi:hypothetical protein